MKECPKCQTVFDNSHNFCIDCGIELVTRQTQPSSTRQYAADLTHPAWWLASIILTAIVVVIVMNAYPQFIGRADRNAPNEDEPAPAIGRPASPAIPAQAFASERAEKPMQPALTRVTPPPPPRYPISTLPAGKPQNSSVPIGPDGLPVDSVVVPDIGALTTKLGETRLKRLSNEELCLLRNEYIIRKGYTLTDKSDAHLTSFFEAEPWYATRSYQGYNNDNPVPWGLFSKAEKDNIVTIQGIEHGRGSWHITHTGSAPREPYPNGE